MCCVLWLCVIAVYLVIIFQLDADPACYELVKKSLQSIGGELLSMKSILTHLPSLSHRHFAEISKEDNKDEKCVWTSSEEATVALALFAARTSFESVIPREPVVGKTLSNSLHGMAETLQLRIETGNNISISVSLFYTHTKYSWGCYIFITNSVRKVCHSDISEAN